MGTHGSRIPHPPQLSVLNSRALRYFWPALFLLMGLFLAVWSDAEIWPRGNLSWAWLLQHDREARQHKIYALLLSAIGVVEYFRANGFVNRFWRAGAFPILAIVGAAALLVHDHTAGSGANSPEARAYLINPVFGPDGSSPIPPAPETVTMGHSTTPMDHASMAMNPSSTDHSSIPLGNNPAISNTPSLQHHHHTALHAAGRTRTLLVHDCRVRSGAVQTHF